MLLSKYNTKIASDEFLSQGRTLRLLVIMDERDRNSGCVEPFTG
jgi:hypothetical protein